MPELPPHRRYVMLSMPLLEVQSFSWLKLRDARMFFKNLF